MAKKPAPSTLPSLLLWTPPHDVVVRFKDERVRTATLRSQLSRAVSETLTDADATRDEIAQKMSEWLGENVSKEMLDNYASEAKEDHAISLPRAIALIEVTGDVRLLQLIAEMFGHVVIESRYLYAVDEAMVTEEMERLAKKKKQCRKAWKGGVS
ncbi:phage regulatory CII family protein [Magnetovibrio sp.]|uniref:phage regulatory CII family protein n=1 Tax=Magnetovibrio sp. TaxID=2024836 RepID=UPI002F9249A0